MIERVSYMDNNSIRFPNTYVHVVFVVDLTSRFTSRPPCGRLTTLLGIKFFTLM